MATKVKLQTYRPTGKWYDTIEYETAIEVWNGQELIEEACAKAQEDMNFTIEARADVENGEAMNKRLVIRNYK